MVPKSGYQSLESMELFPTCRLECLHAFPHIINSHIHKGVNFGTPQLEGSG